MDGTLKTSAEKIANSHTRYLLYFTLLIVLVGIAGSVASIYNDSHWMEAPGITIMVLFMPLTAISYLHYRLPKKKEEYNQVKVSLHAENNSSELYSVISSPEDSGSDYLLPIFFVTFLSFLGFSILFSNLGVVLFNGMDWVRVAEEGIKATASSGIEGYSHRTVEGSSHLYDTANFRRSIVAVGMAFLGAYIWSIQYIFRRMMTLDLPPGAYYSVGSRMIYSAFLAVIFQHFMVGAGSLIDFSDQLIVVAFLIGIFPERALAWLRERFSNVFAHKKDVANSLPLEMIEGVSGFHKARLNELGIDNVQNLAHASLMELILKTPFRPRILVDWMAQARLCLEFKEYTSAIRRAGVRTILDLQEAADCPERVAAISADSGVKHSVIETVIKTNSNEPAIDRLREAYDALNVI